MFEVKQTHCGQYKAYGDFFRVWEITTEASVEETMKYFYENIHKLKTPLPSEGEWRAAIRFGTGEHSGDASYYFRGYYKIERIENGYRITVCEPYAD
ncbi:hypothetical protein [Suilimivivens sp.]|uniref:hypothetical protein n=1 Tax=Suilimivivens sp. TaxID=2981669 RepID=UPI00307B4748